MRRSAPVAARLLRVRLSRIEWAAVAVVCAGLAPLGPASGAEGDEEGAAWLRWAAGRRRSTRRTAVKDDAFRLPKVRTFGGDLANRRKMFVAS
ncbi:hypothetical protein ADK65_32855 [Streptomyces sp. NRRL B-1140]|nr:hypothetical protein ADK65_32855 [Streptomyces sp. NRRL B-1140]